MERGVRGDVVNGFRGDEVSDAYHNFLGVKSRSVTHLKPHLHLMPNLTPLKLPYLQRPVTKRISLPIGKCKPKHKFQLSPKF